MIETQRTEIDGVKYICEMMPATKAHKVLIELLDILGRPALVAIATGAGGKGFDAGIDVIAEVASRLLTEKLTPDSSDRIIKIALDGVKAEGVGAVNEEKIFDNHFRSRILHLYKVFAWAIRVNYMDFFNAADSNPSISGVKSLLGKVSVTLTAMMSSLDSSSSPTQSH